VCGMSHEHVEDGYKGIHVKFGAKNPTELGGYGKSNACIG